MKNQKENLNQNHQNHHNQIEELILSPKENGVKALLLIFLSYVAGIALIVVGGSFGILPLFVVGTAYCFIGWIFFLGLKVVKPLKREF